MTSLVGLSPFPGFGDFAGRVWLNTAHQGALSLQAAEAARKAVTWKTNPFELTQERFDSVPMRLRIALGRLLNVQAEEIILANSASYGLHLIASAYPWSEGDEVLAVHGDFPSDILPWLLLEQRYGVKVVRIRPRGRVVEPDELKASVTPRTRVFCTTLVHSFSGFTVDFEALGTICREHGVRFVLNGSQALGARPIDLSEAPVDAFISVGFKWLCGPYGTGFTWVRPELLQHLRPTKAYWLTMQIAENLENDATEIEFRAGFGARSYDVFGTANFFNFVPFVAAIKQLTALGIARIQEHDQALVSHFVDGIDRTFYTVTSPNEPGLQRSSLVFFSHKDKNKNPAIHEMLTRAGVDLALRGGAMRLAPHLYNRIDDIDRTLSALHDFR